MPLQNEADDASTYVSIRIQWWFRHYDIKNVTDTSYNFTGQADVERSKHVLKEKLNKKGVSKALES